MQSCTLFLFFIWHWHRISVTNLMSILIILKRNDCHSDLLYLHLSDLFLLLYVPYCHGYCRTTISRVVVSRSVHFIYSLFYRIYITWITCNIRWIRRDTVEEFCENVIVTGQSVANIYLQSTSVIHAATKGYRCPGLHLDRTPLFLVWPFRRTTTRNHAASNMYIYMYSG